MIPSGSVDTLTSEDFRLLLNGVGDINVTTLISYTSFNDESGGRLHQPVPVLVLELQTINRRSFKITENLDN